MTLLSKSNRSFDISGKLKSIHHQSNDRSIDPRIDTDQASRVNRSRVNRPLSSTSSSGAFASSSTSFDSLLTCRSSREPHNIGLDLLRGCLVSSVKEIAFKKVVQATMVRDRQHGPVIELNRLQVKRSRHKGGHAGVDGCKSVFGQMCNKMTALGHDDLLLPHRVWKVRPAAPRDFVAGWDVRRSWG